MSIRIPTRNRRQAMDWSLALVSQEIECAIDHSDENGWGLIISDQNQIRALEVIHQYRLENLGWPWRQKIFKQHVAFDWGCLGWVALIGLFFWFSANRPSLKDAGIMDGAAVSQGEWWRLFTAIYLHANLGHLAANACIGLALLGLTMGRYGTGIGLLAAYVTGAGGNLLSWLMFKNHLSLGASGMVLGCVGLITVQVFSFRRHPYALRNTLGSLAVGLMLFVLMGVSPGTDIAAHFGGFISGILLGVLLIPAHRLAQNKMANAIAALLFCVFTLLPWWLALSKAR